MWDLLDLIILLTWLPRALWRLWRWLTEERALIHQTHAARPDMRTVRVFARIALGLWLLGTIGAAYRWFDAWGSDWQSFLTGLAIFTAGPVLLVLFTGWWRDLIIQQHGLSFSR
jgi:hypothetical protein